MYIENSDDVEDDYFRIGVFSMGDVRDGLAERGMIDLVTKYPTGEENIVEWAPMVPTGILYWKLCSNDGWLVTSAEIKAGLAGYHDWLLGATPDVTSTPPAPVEVGARAFLDGLTARGATVYEGRSIEQPDERVERFIRWMAIAADHGGFRVW